MVDLLIKETLNTWAELLKSRLTTDVLLLILLQAVNHVVFQKDDLHVIVTLARLFLTRL